MRYLWTAYFDNGDEIVQPIDDRYSKHDDSAEYNPSAFRDIQEHEGEVTYFVLDDGDGNEYLVDLVTGTFTIESMDFSLEEEPLRDRKLIYYREMEADYVDGEMGEPRIVRYAMGYEGKNSEGKVIKKVIHIDG